MTAIRPGLYPLEGQFLRLEPLSLLDLSALYPVIGHPAVFAGGFGGGPSGYQDTLEGFVAWAPEYIPFDRGNPYAVRLVGGPHDGTLVGTTSLADFEPAREAAHLGWSAYDPRVWGTAVNAEAKLLLLDLVFSHRFGRVKIQADALNTRSIAAIAGIGATCEGVVRRDRRRPDGSWRDTVVYSILAEEWPHTRELLSSRLSRYEGRPVLFRSRLFA